MLPVNYKYTDFLQDKINVIFGPSGCGKSMILNDINNQTIDINIYVNKVKSSRFYGSLDDYTSNIITIFWRYEDYLNISNIDNDKLCSADKIYNHIIYFINKSLNNINSSKYLKYILLDDIDRYLDIFYLQKLLDYLNNIDVDKIIITAHSYDLLYLAGQVIYVDGSVYSFKSYEQYILFMKNKCIDVNKQNKDLLDKYNDIVSLRINELIRLQVYTISGEALILLKKDIKIIDALISLKDIISKYFHFTKLCLEKQYGEEKLILTIHSTDDISTTMNSLDRFDDEYWLDYVGNIDLLIDVCAI